MKRNEGLKLTADEWRRKAVKLLIPIRGEPTTVKAVKERPQKKLRREHPQ